MSNSDAEKEFIQTKNPESDKRCCIAAAFLAIFATISIILLSVTIYLLLTKRYYDSLCLSKDCTLTASTFIDAMDQSVDPCKDFYQFSCGDFIRKTPVDDDEFEVTTYDRYQETFNLQLKNLIESHYAYNDTNIVFRLQESYHLCLNSSENREKEFEALKNYIFDIYDGWPLAQGSRWKTKHADITDYFVQILKNDELVHFILIAENVTSKQYMLRLRKIYFFDIGYFEDVKEVDLDAQLNETAAEKRERERNEKETEKRKKARNKLLHNILRLFGERDIIEINSDVKKMKELTAFMEKKFNPDDNVTEMTIREMNEKSDDEINWLKIFKAKFPEKERSITLKTKVLVDSEENLRAIPLILDKFPRSALVNAMILGRISADFIEMAGDPRVVKLIHDYYAEIQENYRPLLRWQVCLKMMGHHYPLVITRLFINKYVDKKSKRTVDEMIQMIQEAYKQRIMQSEWLDQPTKDRAVKKAEGIHRFVAYPDAIFDNAKLESRYSYISRAKSTWFWESINLIKVLYRFWKETLEANGNLEEIYLWHFNPMVINAFYDTKNNSIWFPSGILQLPFFHQHRLAAINFGMIGAVIGHEIGHAFDDDGSLVNEKGERENWWTNSTREAFEKRSECFVDQYNKFCPEELQGGKDDDKICVNGRQTLGENLADFTGLNAAFDAYKLWVKKYGEESRLPSLEKYTPEQLFFIGFGYSWCEVIMPDKWVYRYEGDSHSPGKYRTEGAISNSKYFREAFKCAKGQMNRGSDSCSLW